MPRAEQLVRRLLEAEPAQPSTEVKDPWTFTSDVDRRMLDEYYPVVDLGDDDHLDLEDAYGSVRWSVDWDLSQQGVEGFEITIHAVDVTAEFTVFRAGGTEASHTERVVYPSPTRAIPASNDPKATVMALAPRDWTATAYVEREIRGAKGVMRVPLRVQGLTVDWHKHTIVVGF